ncbi:MAG TPA: alpha/beta fold hydrolase [Candidatus Dormibacteraeota bacterium]
MALWEALAARDQGLDLNPRCASRAWLHGGRTQRCSVLLHGITNCPQQWARVAEILHTEGQNVLVPRYPHHGLRDRLNTDIARLTPEELEATGEEVLAAAAELGEKVTLIGLSLGGVLAAWLAQRQAEVDVAVLVAPLFGIRHLPAAALPGLRAVARRGPNLYLWWDARLKAKLQPEHGYPRVATRAFGALLELGHRVERESRRAAPFARALVVVTNAADPAVDNRASAALARRWRAHGADVTEYEFPAELGLPHDLIDPSHREAAVERVYPRLLELVKSAEAGTAAGTATH